MCARQPPTGLRLVVEDWNIEHLGRVAAFTLTNRLGLPKLTEMDVVVTAGAGSGHSPITASLARLAVLGRRVMAGITLGGCVSAREGPGAVIDLRKIPSRGIVAVRAASLSHLSCKLIAVGVRVTLGASLLFDVKIETRPRSGVTPETSRCRVPAREGEARRGVLDGIEQRGLKPCRVVTRPAFPLIGPRELSSMLVLVTVDASPERELSIPLVTSQRRLVAGAATDVLMLASERIVRATVRGETDGPRQSHPGDRRMARPACSTEWRLVYRSVARYALRPLRWRVQVSSVVTRRAGHRRMSVGEARTGVLWPHLGGGDGLPFCFVVAIDAPRAQLARVWVLVTVGASLERHADILRRLVVTLHALDRLVRPMQRIP